MPHRPHVLYVAWGFPPSRGGGVYRALATANAFAAAGADVTVLTITREAFLRYTGVDLSLEGLVDDGVEIVRTDFFWENLETDVRRWPWARAHVPRLWGRWRRTREKWRRFPEPGYSGWREPMLEAAERIHRERPVDLVVATANPAIAWLAAWELHRRHGVPFVLDQRDAWTLDVFSGDRLHAESSKVARWERRLVAEAREVWFVNEPIRAWHAREYPEHADKLHVVENGWDEGLAPAQHMRPAPTGALTFGYIGTVSAKVPLAEFVEGWTIARDRDADVADAHAVIRGYLGFYAAPGRTQVETLEQAEAVGVEFGGPVEKVDVASVYDGFDVLLLILGSGRYVTSGKVYEYLSTGLPVVSVHDPGNAATDVLRGYPLWFPAASLAPEDIADALVRAAAAAREVDEATRAAALEFGARFRRDLQLVPRVHAVLGTDAEVAR